MSDIQTEFLFEINLNVPRIVDLGVTPFGHRRIAEVAGGSFEGPKLKGTVHPGGGDWIIVRPDKVTQLDVRLTLETDDGELIYMTYHGFRHGPDEVMARLNAGEMVDASEYYFRTAPGFETGSDKYAWLNSTICVSTGRREASGPIYRVFEVL
jgi:hypothetical protein